jgi:hypothetical protein
MMPTDNLECRVEKTIADRMVVLPGPRVGVSYSPDRQNGLLAKISGGRR